MRGVARCSEGSGAGKTARWKERDICIDGRVEEGRRYVLRVKVPWGLEVRGTVGRSAS